MADTGRKTGTREWAKHNLNIAQGCSHACRYCYARQNALRFKRIGSIDEWPTMTVDRARVGKGYGKRKNDDPDVYDVMFPTSHDITPEILDECLIVLRKVLAAGNTVLIVSKPHWECIQALTEKLLAFKDQVVWRFTIGADDNKVLSFWEPGAPSYDERFKCLKHCYHNWWKTSVSVEPMLDPENIDRLVYNLANWTSETIWIGKGNKMKLRCPDVDPAVIAKLEAGYTDEKILAMVKRLDDGDQQIKWKDSIKLVIEAHS